MAEQDDNAQPLPWERDWTKPSGDAPAAASESPTQQAALKPWERDWSGGGAKSKPWERKWTNRDSLAADVGGKAAAAASGYAGGLSFLGGAAAAQPIVAAWDPAIAVASGPLAPITVPAAHIVGGLIGGTAAQFAEGEVEKGVAGATGLGDKLKHAKARNPGYETAGSLAAMGPAALKGGYNLIRQGLLRAAESGGKAAAKELGKTAGAGTAAGTAFEGFRYGLDEAIYHTKRALGMDAEKPQPPTVEGALENAALGTLLHGLNYKFKDYDFNAVSDIVRRKAAGEQLSPTEDEVFKRVGTKLKQAWDDSGGKIIKDPKQFELKVRQSMMRGRTQTGESVDVPSATAVNVKGLRPELDEVATPGAGEQPPGAPPALAAPRTQLPAEIQQPAGSNVQPAGPPAIARTTVGDYNRMPLEEQVGTLHDHMNSVAANPTVRQDQVFRNAGLLLPSSMSNLIVEQPEYREELEKEQVLGTAPDKAATLARNAAIAGGAERGLWEGKDMGQRFSRELAVQGVLTADPHMLQNSASFKTLRDQGIDARTAKIQLAQKAMKLSDIAAKVDHGRMSGRASEIKKAYPQLDGYGNNALLAIDTALGLIRSPEKFKPGKPERPAQPPARTGPRAPLVATPEPDATTDVAPVPAEAATEPPAEEPAAEPGSTSGVSDGSHASSHPSSHPSSLSQAQSVDEAAHEAASSPENDKPEPTTAQIVAGNAELGHPRIAGMSLSIESPEGAIREDKKNTPPTWRRTMKAAHYGYVASLNRNGRRISPKGRDKDHVDVFVKPGTPEDYAGKVHVIDQIDPSTGRYDEAKVMLGYDGTKEARKAYLANYEKGWGGLGAITTMPIDKFKDWLASGRTKRAVAYREPKASKPRVEKPMRPPETAQELVSQASTKVLSSIIRNGGIELTEKRDITGEGREGRAGGMYLRLFRKDGMTIDRVKEVLLDLGYFNAGEDGDVTGDSDAVRAIVRAAIENSPKVLNKADGQKLQEMLAADSADEASAAAAAGLNDLERQRANLAFEASRVMSEDELSALAERHEDDDTYFQKLQEAVDEKREQETNRIGSGDEEATAGEAPGLELTGQTEAERRAEEERVAEADRKTADERKAAEQKSEADREREDFTLTGSNRSADVAAARGQKDLLSAPEPAKDDLEAAGFKKVSDYEWARSVDQGKSVMRLNVKRIGADKQFYVRKAFTFKNGTTGTPSVAVGKYETAAQAVGAIEREIAAHAVSPERDEQPAPPEPTGVRQDQPGYSAPIFYSKMERAFAQKLPNKVNAKLLAGQVEAWQKGGFSKDELEWSGIAQWLRSQDGTVTKQQVLDFVRANNIKVEEVVKGGEGLADVTRDIDRRVVELTAKGYTPVFDDLEGTLIAVRRNSDGREWEAERPSTSELALDNVPDEISALVTDIEEMAALKSDPDDSEERTKFGQYTLPGAKEGSYRELLLTLPHPPAVGGALPEGYRTTEQREARTFRSAHFDVDNVLAHIRFNERTDADGKRVLFVEEIQSDWMQKTRRVRKRVSEQVENGWKGMLDKMKAAGLKVECD